MYTTKISTSPDDIELMAEILRKNPRISSHPVDPMSEQQIVESLKHQSERLKEKTVVVCYLLKDGQPLAFYSGYILKTIGGWIIHGPRVAEMQNSYYKTANLCSLILDALIEYMESRMFFKFWAIDVKDRHITRRNIMLRYSKKLGQYNLYDEMYIPGGHKTDIIVYDSWATEYIGKFDRMVRMYSLKPEFRNTMIDAYYIGNKNGK